MKKDTIPLTEKQPDLLPETVKALKERAQVAQRVYELLMQRHGRLKTLENRFAVPDDPTSDLIVFLQAGLKKLRVIIPAPGEPGEPRIDDDSNIEYEPIAQELLGTYQNRPYEIQHTKKPVEEFSAKELAGLQQRKEKAQRIHNILVSRHGSPTAVTQGFEVTDDPLTDIIINYTFGLRNLIVRIPMYNQPTVTENPHG